MAFAFNSDIFLTETDREMAKRAFPNVSFALNNPALREIFELHDHRANTAKKRSRRWGVLAVLLATTALVIAASSSLYNGFGPETTQAVSIVGALCGIAGVSIGYFGVMFRGRKLLWLTDRLATERMRQFHFQHYAAHGGAILRGARDPAAAEAYLKLRDRDFERFKVNFLSRLEDAFHAMVETEDAGGGLLFDFMEDIPPADDPNLEEYYRAYELLRFQRQLDYCNLLLSERRSVWQHSPARQAKFFSAFAIMCLGLILAIDSLIFLGAIINLPMLATPIFSVAGIWMAFFALSARTIEEGLQPRTEVERMRQYRIAINRSYDRFRAARTPEEKIEPMVDLENASYEEMLPFLKTNFEARFVM